MKNKIIKIREGNTGILYISQDGKSEQTYIPDSDLEKTRQLLLEFQELRCTNGKSLKDNYNSNGFNWYPSMVSFLYWHYFFPYVRYQNLLQEIFDKKIIINFSNKAEFYNIYRLLSKNIYKFDLKFILFYLLLRIKYIEVVPPGRIIDIIKYLLKKMPYYYYKGISFRNRFKSVYKLSLLDPYKKRLFKQAIDHLENTLSASINEFNIHNKLIYKSNVKVFYGFDDCNEYIFPLLYALNKNNIKTIGHQHGAYVKRHAGYIMEGISREDFKWFDKIIVWGSYWKKHLLSISKVYFDEKIVIGSSKIKYDYSLAECANGFRKNILIPYEFVGNTYEIGKYIEKFLELGYNVYFKPRPDEKIEDQLEAYCLSKKTKDKIIIAQKLDNELMAKIDSVAGAMTTLIYEMLPYGKIIWILDTEYKHLEDLVEDGLAHKIFFNELDNLNKKYFTKTIIDADDFYCSENLSDTIKKQVLAAF